MCYCIICNLGSGFTLRSDPRARPETAGMLELRAAALGCARASAHVRPSGRLASSLRPPSPKTKGRQPRPFGSRNHTGPPVPGSPRARAG